MTTRIFWLVLGGLTLAGPARAQTAGAGPGGGLVVSYQLVVAEPLGYLYLPEAAQPGQDQETPPCEQRRRLRYGCRLGRRGATFALDTRYGRVRVVAWGKPEIRVEAELVARAETPVVAAALLAGLDVQWLDYDARTGGPSANTRFGPALRGRCSGSECSYEVNYTVWLPPTAALRLTTAFADVTLTDDWQGPTDLRVSYGQLRTARLGSPRNAVRIANGDATLPYARQATLEADYARLRLDAGERIVLRTNYSDVDVGTVQDLTVHSQYGDVALGTVRSLRGSSGYSHFSVERLSEALDMAVRYCPDFEVRDLGAGFRQVRLDGGYSTIRLGFAGATPSFRFEVSTEQGQLLVDRKLVRVLQQGGQGPGNADVLGVYGGGAAAPGAGNVSIRVRYGTVRFSK